VTLSFTEALDRKIVSHATDLVAGLVARPEVTAAWTRESSCAGMSVGGLTRHLASQSINVVRLSRADVSAGESAETIDLLEHYARASWVVTDLDSEANQSIRTAADREASDGPDAAATALADARNQLDAVLAGPAPAGMQAGRAAVTLPGERPRRHAVRGSR